MTSPDDLAQAAPLTAGRNGWSTTPVPELGVEPMILLDGPLGLVSPGLDERETSYVLPSGTALAATWDLDLVREVGSVIGAQGVERGIDIVLAPNVNLPRTPLSGRAFEMFAEDPLLSGLLAVAWAAGAAEQGLGACAKHLVCNDTETERRFMNAKVSQTTLREVYLVPFEMLVAAGVPMVLMAYNKVNGTPCAANGDLISILKHDWGFNGVVVSDWYGVDETIASANGGLDLEMPGPPRYFGQRFLDAVRSGDVPAHRLADATARIVRLAERTGKRPLVAPRPPADPRPVDAPDILERAAAASFVLLENRDGLLPLNPHDPGRIAVIGPNAAAPCLQGGTFATVRPQGTVNTPLDAIRARVGEVPYAQGVTAPAAATLPALGTTAPNGSPGVLLECFADGGSVAAHTDVRQSSSLVWFGEVPGLGADARGRIRLTARLTPSVAGSWTFAVGGTGDATLTVDGTPVVRRDAPPLHDIMGAVARADTTAATVQLAAGREVETVAEVAVRPGHVHAITATALPPQPTDALAEAEAAARAADTVILVVGDHQGSSRESADRTTMALAADQVELVRRITAVNPRTAVVVNASRAVDLSWAPSAGAVLMGWFAGQEFGPALASVLFGDRDPRGRLPITVPMRNEDIPGWGTGLDADLTLDYDASEPTGYRHAEANAVPARYPFGHGLGYTTFAVADVSIVDSEVVAVVRNTGSRRGRDVIQAYVRGPGERSARFAGFAAVTLDPGEAGKARLMLPGRSFERWDEPSRSWTRPAGEWEVRIGRSSTDISATLTLNR